MSGEGGDKLNEISIFAFNVCGLNARIKKGFNFEPKGKDEKVDIFMLSETMMKDEIEDEMKQSLKIDDKNYEIKFIPALYTRGEGRPRQGYLFGFKKKLNKNVKCKFVDVLNQWVIKISSKKEENTRPTYIVPVYINGSEFASDKWNDSFEELKFLLLSLNEESKNVMLIGDFNAWVGDAQILNEVPTVLNLDVLKKIRKCKAETINNIALSLIGWCEENGLTLLNGRTKSDKKGNFTRKEISTIDLCFVQGHLHQCVTDFEVMEENWGSDHHPIVAKLQLSFSKNTPILFTDLLAASTRLFKATGTAKKIIENEEDKEKAQKSKKLLKKYMDQVVNETYIRNLSKMFAKLKDTQVLHKLAKKDKYFFGVNIKLETTIFVQNMEKLFRNVISKKLVDFPEPLEEDEIFYRDVICRNGDFEDIVQSFLKAKNVLFACIIHFHEPFFKSLNKEVLLCKIKAFGISKKPFTELLNLPTEESFIQALNSSESELRRHCLRILMASLEDYLPGGINSEDVNKKLVFYNDNCIILAETPTMIQRMIKEFIQYCASLDITVDLKKSKLLVYENTGRSAYYHKLICGDQEISKVIYTNYYESYMLNEMVKPEDECNEKLAGKLSDLNLDH